MRFETVYNTGATPQLVDADGRVLAAGQWACADVETELVAAALAAGRFVIVATPDRSPTGTDPGARDAFTATRAARAALVEDATAETGDSKQATPEPATPPKSARADKPKE